MGRQKNTNQSTQKGYVLYIVNQVFFSRFWVTLIMYSIFNYLQRLLVLIIKRRCQTILVKNDIKLCLNKVTIRE